MNPDDLNFTSLTQTIHELNARIVELESKLEEEKWLESALKRRTQDLSERMKELNCLIQLLELGNKNQDLWTSKGVEVMKIIQQGWQFPELTEVRIQINNAKLSTPGYAQTTKKISEPIFANKKMVGAVDVGYRWRKNNQEEAFLKEEMRLLKAIALWMGLISEEENSPSA